MAAAGSRLSRPAQAAIRRARSASTLAFSAITIAELGALLHRGCLRSTDTTEATIHRYLEEIAVLRLTDAMAVASSCMSVDMLPDPMDCIVAATARSEGIRYGRSASAELHITQNDLVVRCGWRHS